MNKINRFIFYYIVFVTVLLYSSEPPSTKRSSSLTRLKIPLNSKEQTVDLKKTNKGKEQEKERIPITIHYGLSTRQGDRRTMEDADAIHPKLTENFQFFAIYDGHYGQQGAQIASQLLHKILAKELPQSHSTSSALKKAFHKTNKKINTKDKKTGTTAVVALIETLKRRMHIAWVGDSRAVLARQDKVIFATQDHNIKTQEEYDRIKKMGCKTLETDENGETYISSKQWDEIVKTLKSGEEVLTPRFVWKLDGISESTRSLGDARFDSYVISKPEVKSMPVKPNDTLILACDGVWDVMKNQEAVTFVNGVLQESISTVRQQYPARVIVQRGKRNNTSDHYEEEGNLKQILAARALRDEAYNRGSTDNISAMVIKFQ